MNLLETESLTPPALAPEALRCLFSGARVAMWIENAEGEIVDANDAATALVRGAREDLVGRQSSEFLPPRLRAGVAAGGATTEGQVLTADGVSARVQILSVPVSHGDEEATLVTLWEDVAAPTDEAASEELDLSHLEAERASDAEMRAAARRMATLLNHHLTPITGYASLIEAGAARGRLDADHIEGMSLAAKSAAELANHLLEYSDPEPLQESCAVDAASLIDSFHERLQLAAGDSAELVLHLSPSLSGVEVDADQGALCGALEQLVCNATQSVSSRPVAIDVRAGLTADGGSIRIEVGDDGPGIDRADAERVFDPFFASPAGRETAGLGLPIALAAIRSLGGGIEVTTGDRGGAAFVVTLPAAGAVSPENFTPIETMQPTEQPTIAQSPSPATNPSAPAPQAAAEPVRRQVARGGKETVLVVEDEEMVRDLVKRSLGYLGYNVLDACNGEEGLEVARQRRDEIDMIFSDIVMPRMSGPEMVAKMGAEQIDLPVLYTTGFTDNKRLLDNGEIRDGVNLLPKPYTTKVLAARVREVLDGIGA